MSVANPVIDFIDGPARRIHLLSGVTEWHPVDDIYFEVKNRRQFDESIRGFDMFCDALPLIETGEGSTTGRGLVLLLGTRITPFDEDTFQDITGALLSDVGLSGTDLIDTTPLTPGRTVKLNYEPPPGTEVVNGGGVSSDSDCLPPIDWGSTQIKTSNASHVIKTSEKSNCIQLSSVESSIKTESAPSIRTDSSTQKIQVCSNG